MTYNVSSGTLNSTIPIHASLFSIPGSNSERIITRSSAVAERPRDASRLSVVSFNILTVQFFITITAASDLLVHKILLNSVLLSPIVSGGVRPKLTGKKAGGEGRTGEERQGKRKGEEAGRKREERVSPPNKNPGYGALI